MGIPSLMTYVTQRAETFSKKFDLHNTKLVIDGYCIACQLYHSNNCNYCFGGDYGEYAYYVSEFLDDLLKCNITPLIIFDGGLEDKKLKTILTRSKQKLVIASCSTAANEQEILPLMAKDIFRYIVQQKKIKIVQSSFEADDHIASIARFLGCPVLSNDSDFYIFDVMYIPFDSLKNGIFKNTNGHGFVKHCRVYTNDDFVSNFPGMDKKNLPLAAALLGNDYVDSNIFSNFFSSILTSTSKLQKIEMVFKWLQYRSIDNAVKTVLKKLDSEKRELVLEIIEMVINGYLIPSSEMLIPLGYTSVEINKMTEALECKPFKFDQTEALKSSKKNKSKSEIQKPLTPFDKDTMDILSLNDSTIMKPNVNCQVDEYIPSWFMKEYNAANFPGYFMDMLHRQLIVISEQMEDQKYPACVNISLKIIRVMFKLLSNGTTNSKTLKYIAREKGANVGTYELDCDDEFFKGQELPTLDKLIELSKGERKQILTSTLQVSDRLVMEFPPNWRLYISVIKYWLVEADKMFVTKWHLYSLILMMIYHVVKRVIQLGSYFGRNATVINKSITENEVQSLFVVDMPVKNALEKVQKTDCMKAEEFFATLKSKNQENFNITTVHSFSLLQNSLRFSVHLNALLGYAYPNFNIGEFFNGTLIYNFYSDLRKYNHLNKRISAIFENSPSILQLFISISTKIQALTE